MNRGRLRRLRPIRALLGQEKRRQRALEALSFDVLCVNDSIYKKLELADIGGWSALAAQSGRTPKQCKRRWTQERKLP